MKLVDSIVPAYPYEGGLYWLMGEVTTRHSLGHSYYRTLYGLTPEQMATNAGALSCLFEKIELASADHALPEYRTYSDGNSYYHPDLRISMSWEDKEWSDEGHQFADFAIRNELLKKHFDNHALFKGDRYAQEHFLCRLIQQIRLAIRKNAILVGDGFFQESYRVVAPYIKGFIDDTPGSLPENITLALGEKTLAVAGLNFSPSNFDEFAAIRASKEISSYASSFRKAISKANESGSLESTLLQLMAEAMETAQISKFASGALQTTGSILSVAGLIPVIGTATSIAGIANDIAGRALTAKLNNDRWYLLGPKMKEVAMSDLLKKIRGLNKIDNPAG